MIRPGPDWLSRRVEASYSHLREFAPAVLAAIGFDGAAASRSLFKAVKVLVDLRRAS